MTDHRGATMRHRLAALGDWLTIDLPHKLRHITPPSGQQYELFDCATFVLILVGVGYVIDQPSAAQQAALGWFAGVIDLTVWGSVLTFCAACAVLASYHPNHIDFGYGILIAGCLFWSLAFAIGIVFFDGSSRSIISVLIYGWVVRRLIAVRMRGR